MRNVAITLKYLGTAYHGWQVQKTQVTVGETVEKAVAMVVGHPVHVTGCGRTDAGVHARMAAGIARNMSWPEVRRMAPISSGFPAQSNVP